jgi:hypothetical protein
MIDTSKMTDGAFLRTLRMRYRSAGQPEVTTDEVRRLLDIASGFRIDVSQHDADLLQHIRRERVGPGIGLDVQRHHGEGHPDA